MPETPARAGRCGRASARARTGVRPLFIPARTGGLTRRLSPALPPPRSPIVLARSGRRAERPRPSGAWPHGDTAGAGRAPAGPPVAVTRLPILLRGHRTAPSPRARGAPASAGSSDHRSTPGTLLPDATAPGLDGRVIAAPTGGRPSGVHPDKGRLCPAHHGAHGRTPFVPFIPHRRRGRSGEGACHGAGCPPVADPAAGGAGPAAAPPPHPVVAPPGPAPAESSPEWRKTYPRVAGSGGLLHIHNPRRGIRPHHRVVKNHDPFVLYKRGARRFPKPGDARNNFPQNGRARL